MSTYDDRVTLWHGDCREVLRLMPDASIDSIVTDPPYELGFMGKGWDASGVAYDAAMWAECLRVLKPGGHLLAFGGSRTWHRLAAAIEDAGFELRDSIAWLYGSGFPKSLNVSKAIDKVRSEDRAPVDAVRSWLNARRIDAGFSHDAVNKHFGHASNGGGSSSSWMTNPTLKALPTWDQWLDLKALFGFGDDMDDEVRRLNGRKGKPGANFEAREVLSERVSEVKGGSWADNVATGRFQIGEKIIRETAPATDDALTWQGWGTALKPAFEPIVVARKPLAGTVAANVLEHGTGALNIDACRVATNGEDLHTSTVPNDMRGGHCGSGHRPGEPSGQRRYTESGGTNFAATPGVRGGDPAGRWPTNVVLDDTQAADLDRQAGVLTSGANPTRRGSDKCTPARGVDSGGASRFFPTFHYEAKAPTSERPRHDGTAHPTVKPLDLMRWLVRLVTPPGGLVLDPFAGSGTTAEACIIEGFRCVTIEQEATYLPLIEQRINKPLGLVLDFSGEAS